MTERAFYEAVMAIENVAEEIKEEAEARLLKMDEANERRRLKTAEKASSREAEKAPIREALLKCVGAEPLVAEQLCEAVFAAEGLEVNPRSIPSLMKPLVESGAVEKVEVKGEKGKRKAFQLPTA